MAVGRKEGEAFIEVVAETGNYERDLEKSIARATKAAAKGEHFDALVRSMGDAGQQGGDQFETRFIRELRRRRPDVVRELEKAAQMSGSGFVEIFSGEVFGRGRSGPGLFGSGGLFGRMFSSLQGGLSNALNSLSSDIDPVKFFTSIASSALPLLFIIPAVTAVIIGLGNSLYPLVGLLGAVPALVGGVVVALAPLLIAFQGVGDALSAMTSGDMQKFNDALKKLSPSAASVVRELQRLMPIFGEIRRSVQESFFGRITGDLTRMFKVLEGPLLGGLSNVAYALGNVVHQLLQMATSEKFVTELANLFGSVADGINKNGPTLIRFVDAFFAVANASLPAVSAFLDRLAQGTDKFSAFIQKSVQDGSFQAFLDDAFKTLTDVKDLTMELLGLLKDMFVTTDTKGKTFLEDTTDAVKRLRDFFQSPDGQKFLADMLDMAHDLANILGFIADNMNVLISTFILATATVDALSAAIDQLHSSNNNFFKDFVHVFGGVIPQLIPHFASGTITNGPTLAMVGDNPGGQEAIIPLDDPVRARQIASDPRVADVIGDSGGTTVIAIFDGEPFQARIVKTVRSANRSTALQLAQQPRLVG